MALDTWFLYFLAIIGLSLTPGPNSLLALTHGAIHGHRRTLTTIVGGSAGFFILIALSMFGIGALLRASSEALTLLRWLGGIYLIWLGIQVWRSPPPRLSATTETPHLRARAMLRQGFLAALSNPKGLLFFGAFLPPFINPEASLVTQFVIMAMTFILTEFLVEYALALTASRVRNWLQRVGRVFNRVCGGIFGLIGLSFIASDIK